MASILVVDDEPDLRYLTQVNLELDGHRVMTAANGAEALAAVQVEQPDLILLDVMMPEVDGWTVLERLKGHLDSSIKEIPVLMVTALGSDDDQIRGGIEGAVRFLVKPVSPDRLRDAVRNALDGGPEPTQRRSAQTSALERLARRETGKAESSDPRPRLTKLEHQRAPAGAGARAAGAAAKGDRPTLTAKQAELLKRLQHESSVSTVANELGVSRSNVYASLRRINRKLGIGTVPELLHRLRSGALPLD